MLHINRVFYTMTNTSALGISMLRRSQPSTDSPCIRNCCLDPDDFCMGCGRHLEDILRWSRIDPREREEIMQRAAARTKSRSAPRQP